MIEKEVTMLLELMEVSARLIDFVPLPLLSIDFLLHVINGYSHGHLHVILWLLLIFIFGDLFTN